MNALARDLAARVAIVFVYLQEAHPSDLWPIGSASVHTTHLSIQDRQAAALAFREKHGLEVPFYLDTIAGELDRALGAWPDKCYVVDTKTDRCIFTPAIRDGQYVTDWTEALPVMYSSSSP